MGFVSLRMFAYPMSRLLERRLKRQGHTALSKRFFRSFGTYCFHYENWTRRVIFQNESITEADLAGGGGDEDGGSFGSSSKKKKKKKEKKKEGEVFQVNIEKISKNAALNKGVEYFSELFRPGIRQIDNLDVACPFGRGLIQGLDQSFDHLGVLAIGQDYDHVYPLVGKDL